MITRKDKIYIFIIIALIIFSLVVKKNEHEMKGRMVKMQTAEHLEYRAKILSFIPKKENDLCVGTRKTKTRGLIQKDKDIVAF